MKPYQSFFIGGAGGVDAIADAGLLILRLFAGLALALAHGLGKIPPAEGFVGMLGGSELPAPELFAWLSGFAEFGGGLLLAIGLLTRPASLLIAINMTMVVLIAHTDGPFTGMEKPMLFGVVAVMFLLVGAGRFSVDGFLRARVASHTVGRYARP